MLPSLAPALPPQVRAAAPFIAGYLLAWTATGLTAYALVEAGQAFAPGFLAWGEADVAGGVITTPALYELTPFTSAASKPRSEDGAPDTQVKWIRALRSAASHIPGSAR